MQGTMILVENRIKLRFAGRLGRKHSEFFRRLHYLQADFDPELADGFLVYR
jgi:hypothetical protein